MNSLYPVSAMPVTLSAWPLERPTADCSVRAGLPDKRLDIAELLVEHPEATFIFRVEGSSMQEFGIYDGDLIVVDRALRAKHRSIVVAVVDGKFTVRTLHQVKGVLTLKADNPTCPDIVPKESQKLEIWGVVTSRIKRIQS